jgi:hypothetical protein
MLMINKIKDCVIMLYKILKGLFLILIIFLNYFTCKIIKFYSFIQFLLTCVILIIYKKIHEYIEKKEYINLNVKAYLMWINIYLWFLYEKNVSKLVMGMVNNKWTKYVNKPLLFYLNIIINDYDLIAEFVITKYHKLQKTEWLTNIEQQALMHCEYEILIYKLILFYIRDLEKMFDITESFFKVANEGIIRYSYEYNKNIIDMYYKSGNSNTDKFWDLHENYSFHKKIYTYFNDTDFQESQEYKQIKNIYNWEELLENWKLGANVEIYRGIELKKQEEYLENQLKEWRDEWLLYADQELEKKYDKIFIEIDDIKQKYKKI